MCDDLSLQAKIRLAAHEKLVLKIPLNLRCLFMRLIDGSMTWRAVFCEVPTETDRELLSDALSETAYEFVEIREKRIEYLKSSAAFADLAKFDYWLFVRAEEVDQSARGS
jgi:hypothetical protein